MLKTYIVSTLIAFVICSQLSCLLAKGGADDEFAEFDDHFASNDLDSLKQQEFSNNKKQQQQQADDTIRSTDKLNNKKLQESSSSESGKQGKEEVDDFEDEGDIIGGDGEAKITKKKKKSDLKLVNAPLPQRYHWESYYVEIAFLLASVLYFLNFFLGSAKNNTFAHDWYDKSKEIFKQQFTLVGGAPQMNEGTSKKDEDEDSKSASTTKKQRGLLKHTESMFTLWNSGRIGVDGLLIEIILLKRQDLFSMALNVLKPSKDTIIMRFLLNQEGYENFVFCLAHKAHAPKLARDMVDINTFCPKRKPISQYGINSERLFVMSELSDVATFILDNRTASFVKDYEQSINYIHITDQYSTVRSDELQPAQKLANAKRMATFSFSLPKNDTERSEFLMFSLSLLDRLRRFKLVKDSKQKSEKNRQKITDIIQKTQFNQRQEAAQLKKEEQRRLEKERIYNEDDPEKQKRWEKKEAKRELKKNKMRVKQLKVKSM